MQRPSLTPEEKSAPIDAGGAGLATSGLHVPIKFHNEKLMADPKRVVVLTVRHARRAFDVGELQGRLTSAVSRQARAARPPV